MVILLVHHLLTLAFSKPLNVSGAITCTTLTQTNASGSLSDDKGEIRSVPGNTQTTAYTLVLTDHGKHINTNAQVTVPANVFSAGHSITIANTSNAGINLIQGSGLTLRNAGQTTTGDRVINNYGLVTYFLHLLLKLTLVVQDLHNDSL